MRYHYTKPLLLLLGIVICCLGLGCSNSEFTESTGWEEYANSAYETEGDSPSGKQSCFDNFRLPNLQSATCQEQFYTQDTITDFPESGFFQKTFTIAFPDNKLLNCEIGGKPVTKESPLLSAIQVDSSMTIRCADFSEKIANTEIIRTYILEKNPDIAAVFLTANPNALFDPDTGIYMEGPNAEAKEPHYGANYWLDKEIPVFVELVEPEASAPGFAKYAGLKISGRYSRTRAKKSVAITFREIYGDKRLYYKLFPEFSNLYRFKSFVLRNFGNSFGLDYIRDRLASSLSEGLNVDYQRGRYAVVYYNSNYFGIHDLRERSNEHYFETHYNISHKNINLIKADYTVSSGSSEAYTSLMNWLKNNSLENENNFAHIDSQLDIENYTNYIQTEIITNNWDWPGYNVKIWNSSAPPTLWKWYLYDLDQTFGVEKKQAPNNIFQYFSEGDILYTNTPKHTILFNSLLQNKAFKTSFINRMATLLQTNYESSKILSQIDKMMHEIKEEIPRDQKRWSLNSQKMDKELNTIKEFVKRRPQKIIDDLHDYFKLGAPISTKLSVQGEGTILVHNLPLSKKNTSIIFFSNHPVTISAKPQNNSFWQGWSDGNKNQTRTIYPNKRKELTAIFE